MLVIKKIFTPLLPGRLTIGASSSLNSFFSLISLTATFSKSLGFLDTGDLNSGFVGDDLNSGFVGDLSYIIDNIYV